MPKSEEGGELASAIQIRHRCCLLIINLRYSSTPVLQYSSTRRELDTAELTMGHILLPMTHVTRQEIDL